MLEVALVPPDMVPGILTCIQDKLKKAADITAGRVVEEDIISLILDNRYQLWIAFDPADMDIQVMILTELKKYPQTKWLCVQHCVGSRGTLRAIGAKMMSQIEKFAKTEQCAGVEFLGRIGWDKFAYHMGYEKRCVAYQKIFN
jgi:hypothetical protein